MNYNLIRKLLTDAKTHLQVIEDLLIHEEKTESIKRNSAWEKLRKQQKQIEKEMSNTPQPINLTVTPGTGKAGPVEGSLGHVIITKHGEEYRYGRKEVREMHSRSKLARALTDVISKEFNIEIYFVAKKNSWCIHVPSSMHGKFGLVEATEYFKAGQFGEILSTIYFAK